MASVCFSLGWRIYSKLVYYCFTNALGPWIHRSKDLINFTLGVQTNSLCRSNMKISKDLFFWFLSLFACGRNILLIRKGHRVQSKCVAISPTVDRWVDTTAPSPPTRCLLCGTLSSEPMFLFFFLQREVVGFNKAMGHDDRIVQSQGGFCLGPQRSWDRNCLVWSRLWDPDTFAPFSFLKNAVISCSAPRSLRDWSQGESQHPKDIKTLWYT